MANFGDLKTMDGMRKLNDYMATRSYMEGYCLSDADKKTLALMGAAPPAELCHALRWYNHICILTGCAPCAGKAAAKDKDEGEDFELFGDDDDEEEDAAAAKVREERLAAYAAKKAKKPAVVAKSSVVLDIKPWDDETDLKVMESHVRSVTMDGLLWGASKFVPVAYGVKKLQIGCIVEDEKVSIDDLSEKIEGFEDFVQSVDVAAFNKV